MAIWLILTLTSIAVLLLGLLVAGTVYFVRKYSSSRGDYYTQVRYIVSLQPDTSPHLSLRLAS